MRTVFALFKSYEDAETAVHDLLHRKFDLEQINAIVPENIAKVHAKVAPEEDWVDATESLAGRAFGLDRLLAGRQAIPVPGVGRLLAAGDLAVILVRTASTPIAGGGNMRRALEDFGLPEKAAQAYQSGLEEGGIMLMVRTTDERAAEAGDALRKAHGSHIASYNR